MAKTRQTAKSHQKKTLTNQGKSGTASSGDLYESILESQCNLASPKVLMEKPETRSQSIEAISEKVVADSMLRSALDKLGGVYEMLGELKETYPTVAKVLEGSQMLVQARRNAVLAVAHALGYQGPVEAGINWALEKGERFVNHHAQHTLGFSDRQADTLSQTFLYGIGLTTGMMKGGKGGEGKAASTFPKKMEKESHKWVVSEHGVSRKIERNVRTIDELDALKNPIKVKPVKIDFEGRPSQRYIGKKASVVVNPETNKIISVNPTSSKVETKILKEEK